MPGVPARLALYAQENLVNSLGHPWLMLEDWIVYGVENGTRVDFYFDDPDNVGIKVRLDARESNGSVAEALCAIARHIDCKYFDAQAKQFIDPLPEAILQAVAASRAARFVRTPNVGESEYG